MIIDNIDRNNISQFEMEEIIRMNIHLLLNHYRQYHQFTSSKLSENFKSEESVFVEKPQVPDLIIKTNNPYLDKNQSFFVGKYRQSTGKLKIVEKEYQPNYFIQKQLSSCYNSENGKNNNLSDSSITKENFIFFPELKSKEKNVSNIDIEIYLNYIILNENKRWMIFLPLRDGGIYGPIGTADAFLIFQTKNKNEFLSSRDLFLVDISNEIFLNSSLAVEVLAEEIMSINQNIQNFYTHFYDF